MSASITFLLVCIPQIQQNTLRYFSFNCYLLFLLIHTIFVCRPDSLPDGVNTKLTFSVVPEKNVSEVVIRVLSTYCCHWEHRQSVARAWQLKQLANWLSNVRTFSQTFSAPFVAVGGGGSRMLKKLKVFVL